MLWDHEPQASVSTAFVFVSCSFPQLSCSLKLSRVFLYLDRNTEYMFSISDRKTPRREKGKQLVNFDYQNVNSLCSRHYYVNSAC